MFSIILTFNHRSHYLHIIRLKFYLKCLQVVKV